MKYFLLRTVDLYPTCSPEVPDHFTIGDIVEGRITNNSFICGEGDSCKTYLLDNKELDTIFSGIVEEEPENLSLQRLSDKIPSVELRDLFAMNVLSGFMTGNGIKEIVNGKKTYVKLAYEYADAMLKEREK